MREIRVYQHITFFGTFPLRSEHKFALAILLSSAQKVHVYQKTHFSIKKGREKIRKLNNIFPHFSSSFLRNIDLLIEVIIEGLGISQGQQNRLIWCYFNLAVC